MLSALQLHRWRGESYARLGKKERDQRGFSTERKRGRGKSELGKRQLLEA